MAPVTPASSLDSIPRLSRDLAQEASSHQSAFDDFVAAATHEGFTSTSDDISRRGVIVERQSQETQPIIVPATYIGSNPGANGGEVAGIVLGVVFGIILILWLVSATMMNPLRPVVGTSSVTDVGHNHNRRDRSRTARTRSSGRKTTRSRSRSVVSREDMTEMTSNTRRERGGGGGGGGGGGRSPRRARETVIIEESRRESRPPPPPEDYGDDIVEVIEEESDVSPARRPRRSSGYRNVDPEEYGGGGRPMRKVRR